MGDEEKRETTGIANVSKKSGCQVELCNYCWSHFTVRKLRPREVTYPRSCRERGETGIWNQDKTPSDPFLFLFFHFMTDVSVPVNSKGHEETDKKYRRGGRELSGTIEKERREPRLANPPRCEGEQVTFPGGPKCLAGFPGRPLWAHFQQPLAAVPTQLCKYCAFKNVISP